jgi:hypothetical protein
LFVVTHRTEDALDPSTRFHFVDSVETAMQGATEEAAGARRVELEVRRVYTSPYATHVRYTVKR